MSLAQKVIAVTGAGGGMGRAIAILLAAKGAFLSLSDVNEADLAETASLIQDSSKVDKLWTQVVDVSKTSEVSEWIKATKSKFGRLDGAANVAGILVSGPISQATEQEWDLAFGVNAKGVFNCLQAQLREIVDHGSIVTIASAAGIKAVHDFPIYTASKHAVVGLSNAVAEEAGLRGIRVNTIAPGYIDTPMNTEQTKVLVKDGRFVQKGISALNRPGSPEEIARVVAVLLSEEASFVTGCCWPVDGGYTFR